MDLEPGLVVHACNPRTWEAETGGSQVQDQSQQLSETLSNLVLKQKNKIKMAGRSVAQR